MIASAAGVNFYFFAVVARRSTGHFRE